MSVDTKECQRPALQQREVLSGLACADAVGIFVLDDILDPVQTILDAPVRADDRSKFVGAVASAARQIIVRCILHRLRCAIEHPRRVQLLLWHAQPIDADDPLERRPLLVEGQRIIRRRCLPDRDDPPLDAPVCRLAAFVVVNGGITLAERLDLPVEPRLILLQRDQVVVVAVDDALESFFYNAGHRSCR